MHFSFNTLVIVTGLLAVHSVSAPVLAPADLIEPLDPAALKPLPSSGKDDISDILDLEHLRLDDDEDEEEDVDPTPTTSDAAIVAYLDCTNFPNICDTNCFAILCKGKSRILCVCNGRNGLVPLADFSEQYARPFVREDHQPTSSRRSCISLRRQFPEPRKSRYESAL